MKPTIILKPVLRCSKRMASVPDDKQLRVQNSKCFYCGKTMKAYDSSDSRFYKNRVTKDHFFPKSHGFELVGNKVFCCGFCNNKKHASYPSVKDICNFVDLHRSLVGKKHLSKLVVCTHNNKPRFKLKLTKELINYYTSEPLIRN